MTDRDGGPEAGDDGVPDLHIVRLLRTAPEGLQNADDRIDGATSDPNDRRGSAPLILLHGFTGDATTWSGFVAALDDAGIERDVWAIDLIGHGRSPAPTEPSAWTMSAHVDAVEATIARTIGGPVVLLGYSMGGRVALSWAVEQPSALAGLITIGASPGIADAAERRARRARDEALAADILERGVAEFVERWERHPLFATQDRLGPEHAERMRRQRLRNDPDALAASLRGAGTGSMSPVHDRLHRIDVPSLLVAGALDERYADVARETARAIPGAQPLIVPNAGHAAQLERPDWLARRVVRWLAGPPATG